MASIKIIGLGNLYCGDDAVGNLVARTLRPFKTPSVDIIEGGTPGLTLLHEMDGTDKLIIVDGVASQSEEGTIFRFTLPKDMEALGKFSWEASSASTHQFGLGEALILADALGILPPQVIIYGIEIRNAQTGQPLSPKISEAMITLGRQIVQEEFSPAHA